MFNFTKYKSINKPIDIKNLFFDAAKKASPNKSKAVLWNRAASNIKKENMKRRCLVRTIMAIIESPMATDCLVYPIATTVIRYGKETHNAKKGLGKLLHK